MSEVSEVVAFLKPDQRKEVRQAAVGLVQGLTGSPEGLEKLRGEQGALLPALLRLLPDPDCGRAALVSLVNLSQGTSTALALLELRAVGRAMDYLLEGSVPHPELLVMLLANLTVPEAGCAQLLQTETPGREGYYMAVLLKRFVDSSLSADPASPQGDGWAHIANVLTNVTRLKAGRRLLLQRGRGFLTVLASQLNAGNATRRQGCAAAIRNCCHQAQADGTLEHISGEAAALRGMLGPLSGVKGAGAGNRLVREALAEAIYLLAATEKGRAALWKLQVPELLRKGYQDEEDPAVCDAMEKTGQLFIEGGLQPPPTGNNGSGAAHAPEPVSTAA